MIGEFLDADAVVDSRTPRGCGRTAAAGGSSLERMSEGSA
jgi:hypothetical protein